MLEAWAELFASNGETLDDSEARIYRMMQPHIASIAALVLRAEDPGVAGAHALYALRLRLANAFELVFGNRRAPALPEFKSSPEAADGGRNADQNLPSHKPVA